MHLTPIRVLLVEDNPGDARLVREALRDAGEASPEKQTYELTTVDRLSSALSALAAKNGEPAHDVVLLDLALVDSSGFSTYDRIRTQAPECPVVVLTGHEDVSTRARAMREGAQDFLSKAQFDADSLARSVRYAIDRKQAERDRIDLLRIEAQHREANAQREVWQALFDGALDAMLVTDDQNRYVDANRAASSLLGLSRDDILQLSATDLTPSAAEPHTPDRGLRDLLRDDHRSGEMAITRSDGSVRIVEYNARTALQQGRHLSVLRDVTQRRAEEAERADLHARERAARAEAEAREGQLRVLAEAGAALSAPLDATTTLQRIAGLVVPALADWSSLYILDGGAIRMAAVAHVDPDKEAILRDLFDRYGLTSNDDIGYAKVIRTGVSEVIEDVSDELRTAVAKDPQHLRALNELEARSAMTVPLTVAGRTFGALTFVSSTSKRHYSRSDQDLAEELGRRVAVALDSARLFELARVERRRAEEANRAKDEFLSVASHELRTPLNAILGWVRLLRAGTLTPEKKERAIEVIERNAEVQVQLVEDILDVSRIITGKLRLEIALVDPRIITEAAVDVVKPAADAKAIQIVCHLANDLGLIPADASRLQQIVWNLIANAVKFSPRGGHVEVTVRRDEAHIEICVTDNGQGIDVAFLPHVFEQFRQADGSSTRSHGGLGLGLAIVRHLVELHGGRVEAESEGLNKGARFRVRMPIGGLQGIDDEPPPSVLSARPSQLLVCPPELVGLRILVVDDQSDTRELLHSILTQCNAQVTTVASADEAFDSLIRDSPDLLISDIGMPEQDGHQLIRRIRALGPEAGGGIPAIALTAYTRTEDRARALLEGFTNHVSKPVEPRELLAVIAGAVADRRRSKPPSV